MPTRWQPDDASPIERPPAGWYPDPGGPGYRWWDGARWTADTRDGAPPRKRSTGEIVGIAVGVTVLVVFLLISLGMLIGMLG